MCTRSEIHLQDRKTKFEFISTMKEKLSQTVLFTLLNTHDIYKTNLDTPSQVVQILHFHCANKLAAQTLLTFSQSDHTHKGTYTVR